MSRKNVGLDYAVMQIQIQPFPCKFLIPILSLSIYTDKKEGKPNDKD